MAWTIRNALKEMAEARERKLDEVSRMASDDPQRTKRVTRAVKDVIHTYKLQSRMLLAFADDFSNPGVQKQFNALLKKELSKLDATNHRVF